MAWKPIVAGVDLSAEGLHAARTAALLAQEAGTKCQLVHAVRDPWTATYGTEIPVDFADLNRRVLESARASLVEKLKGAVPEAVLKSLLVCYGRTGAVLAEIAAKEDAELIVLGGKHHSALGRWVAGSTAHYLVRAHDRPLLVVGPQSDEPFRRILVAVDLSAATNAVVLGAERFTALVSAKLAALHVVEPIPLAPGLELGLEVDMPQFVAPPLEELPWPRFHTRDAERIVKRGPAARTVADVAAEWKADLVVVGSHGSSWIDRVLIGSVTEQLLNRLPASLLVVPVPSPGKTSRRQPKGTTQATPRRRAK